MPVGKVLLLFVCLGTVLVDLLALISNPGITAIVRFILTVILCWFLFQLKNWARWVYGALMAVAILFGIFIIAKSPLNEAVLVLAAMVAFYSIALGILFFCSPVTKMFVSAEENNV